jgi:hypothetical protein
MAEAGGRDDDDGGGDDDGGEMVESSATRGFTRSGAGFRSSNKPHYDSLAALVRAHRRVFQEEAALTLIGEVKR